MISQICFFWVLVILLLTKHKTVGTVSQRRPTTNSPPDLICTTISIFKTNIHLSFLRITQVSLCTEWQSIHVHFTLVSMSLNNLTRHFTTCISLKGVLKLQVTSSQFQFLILAYPSNNNVVSITVNMQTQMSGFSHYQLVTNHLPGVCTQQYLQEISLYCMEVLRILMKKLCNVRSIVVMSTLLEKVNLYCLYIQHFTVSCKQ